MKLKTLFTYLLAVCLFGSNIVTYILPDPETCGNGLEPCEDELSLVETILLFPVSMFPHEMPDPDEMLHEAGHIHGSKSASFICYIVNQLWKLLLKFKDHLYNTTSHYLQWTSEVIYAEYLLELFNQGDVNLQYIRQTFGNFVWNLPQTFADLYTGFKNVFTYCMLCHLSTETKEILAIWQTNIVTMVTQATSTIQQLVNEAVNVLEVLTGYLITPVKPYIDYMHSSWVGSSLSLIWQEICLSPNMLTGVLAVAVVPLVFKIGLFKRKTNTPAPSTGTKSKKQTKRSLEQPYDVIVRPGLKEPSEKKMKFTQTSPLNNYTDSVPPYQCSMCELFDSPTIVQGGIHDSLAASNHYRMCEYFDGTACNCGGKDGGQVSMTAELTPCYLFVQGGDTNTSQKKPARLVLHNVEQETIQFPQLSKRDCSAQTSNTQSPRIVQNLVDIPSQEVTKTTANEKTVDTESVEITGTTEQEVSPFPDVDIDDVPNTINELHLSFESEFGQPCCNSSFREDSPLSRRSRRAGRSSRNHSLLLQQSVPDDTNLIGEGDGYPDSPVIVTRRSPRKEVGVSFWSEGTLSDVTSMFDSDLSTSLLDVSDINKNLSFNQGDGVVEFAVMFALQSAYRLTKWFLHSNIDDSSKDLDESNIELYVISPKKHSEKQTSRNVSFNAVKQTGEGSFDLEQNSWERGGGSDEDVDSMFMSTQSICGSEHTGSLSDCDYATNSPMCAENSWPILFEIDIDGIDFGEDKRQTTANKACPDVSVASNIYTSSLEPGECSRDILQGTHRPSRVHQSSNDTSEDIVDYLNLNNHYENIIYEPSMGDETTL